jgi:ABC-type antimicrobial peptide transport system permease subunit
MASSAIERAARTELARIDPDLALFDIKTMSERMELSLSSRRASMSLALGFGATALFLSVIGIYGVLAHLVTQRRREIGIRIALGSTGGGIVRLVFREGIVLVAGGIVLGVAGAAALRQVISGQVYGVQPLDPAVLTVVVALFALVGLGACVMPARRALSVDPALVLTE